MINLKSISSSFSFTKAKFFAGQYTEKINHGYLLITILLISVFFLLGFTGILNHEMWRDELQIWLIARDSSSIAELFKNIKTEGHPSLWYLINFIISRLTDSPFSIQILSVIIGTINAFLIIKWAPFKLFHRILFCFSYYMLFEYTIICRNYGLEFMFIFILCILYKDIHKRYLLISVILFLLANTHLFGTVIAANLGLLLILEIFFNRTVIQNTNLKIIFFSILIFLSGIFIGMSHFVIFLYESGDVSNLMANTGTTKDIVWFAKNISIFLYSFFPIPDFSEYHFWNTNVISGFSATLKIWTGITMSILLMIGSILIFVRKPLILTLYLLNMICFWIIYAVLWYFDMRHIGHFFLMFFVCLWLLNQISDKSITQKSKETDISSRYKLIRMLKNNSKGLINGFLSLILIAQVISAAYAYSRDLKYPFSNAKNLSRYLSKDVFKDHIFIGYMDYAVSPTTTWLKKKIYFPQSKKFGTFIYWSKDRKYLMSDEEIMAEVDSLIKEGNNKLILISNHVNNQPRCKYIGETVEISSNHKLKYIANFGNAIVADENYYVYLIY